MKILIYGADAIASFYAARLKYAGCDVSIFCDEKRFWQVEENGIELQNLFTGQKIITQLPAKRIPGADEYDLVIAFLPMVNYKAKLKELQQFSRVKTILLVGNNISGFSQAAALLGPQRILAGYSTTGAALKGNTVVYAESRTPQSVPRNLISIGELDGKRSGRLKQIKKLFSKADLRVKLIRRIKDAISTQTMRRACLTYILSSGDGNVETLINSRNDLQILLRTIREGAKILRLSKTRILPANTVYSYIIPPGMLTNSLRNQLKKNVTTISLRGTGGCSKQEARMIFMHLIKMAKPYSFIPESIIDFIKSDKQSH